MNKYVLTALLAAAPFSSALAQSQLVVGYEADATSLDPAQVTDLNTMHVLSHMYDTLVKLGPNGSFQPVLASKWQMSKDGLTYTFTLKPNLKFANGDPLNADAVVFSFDRQLNKNNPGYKFGPFPFADFYYGSVASVRKVNASTVEFKLKSPNSAFMAALSVPTSSVVNPKQALAKGKTFALSGGGSGPYMLEKWNRGGQLILKSNPRYWGNKPKSTKLVWVPIVQESQRAVALQSGTVDLVINPASENLAKLKSGGYNIAQRAGPHIWWLGLNLTKAPFDNKLVRQALNYAVDRKAITEGVLYGTGTPAVQPLAPMQLGYNPNVNPYTYDPKKAKDLLAQAGYPGGFTTTLLVPTSGSGMQSPTQMGTAIQAYLGQIGVKVNIQQMDWGTFLSRIGAGAAKSNLDMWELSWMDTAVDPAFVLDPLLSSKSFPPGFNTGQYKNAAVDKLMDQGRAEADPKKRGVIYQKAMALINEDVPWVFVDHAQQVVAYNAKVQGMALDPISPFILKLSNVFKP